MAKTVVEIARRLPKTELHLHLDGSLSTAFVVKKARARGISLVPPLSREDVLNDDTAAQRLRSAIHHMKTETINKGNVQKASGNWPVFDFCNQFLQTSADLFEAVETLCADLVKENVRYAEIRFCPELHTLEGLTSSEAVEAVTGGFKNFARNHAQPQNRRFRGGIIICALRSKPLSHAVEMAELAVNYRTKGVLGFDVAGDEGSYPLGIFSEALNVCTQHGVPITVHAGEWLTQNCKYEGGSLGNLRFALEHPGVKRIGHGIEIVKSTELVEAALKRNVSIECCITSNVRKDKVASFAEHPIREMHKIHKLRTQINSDNTLLSGSVENIASPTNEILNLVKHLSFTWCEVRQILINGIDAAFEEGIENEWREAYIQDIDDTLKDLY